MRRKVGENASYPQSSDLKPFDVGDWVEEKNENDHAVLNCTPPDSFPQPEIQWEKRTDSGRQLITQSAHYVVNQEGDLHFAFVDKTDSAQYQCIVTNKLLTDSNVVRRTVSLNVLPGKCDYHCVNLLRRFTKSKNIYIYTYGPWTLGFLHVLVKKKKLVIYQ